MRGYSATSVRILGDFDYGEGSIEFEWPDPICGYELLIIDVDGHCSRRMPINSGSGWFEFLDVNRNRIKLRFDSALASKLQLDDVITVEYRLTDDEYDLIRRAVDYFGGSAESGE